MATLLAAGACSKAPPNVVLITVDTLRADHVGAYGSSTTATPSLDRLASEGVLFEHMVSPLPETRPAHFSIFTSQYPRQNGVVSNSLSLDQEALTLAEVYSENGYATAAFVGCLLFAADSGAHQGFAMVDLPDQPQRPADQVVPPAVAWLETEAAEQPFFLWLHLFDPHMPYEAPEEWLEQRSVPKPAAARFTEFSWPLIYRIAERHDGNLPRWALRRAKELYAAEVEYADHWVGELFAALERQQLWDGAIVAVTADHGECFEGGVYFDHSHCLGEGALAVPFLIRAPGLAPGRVTEVVEHLDLAPTLLALSGIEIPPAFSGRNLVQAALEPRPAYFQHPYYSEKSMVGRRNVAERLRSVASQPTTLTRGEELQMGVRWRNWKYVLRGSAGELVDLDQPPVEGVRAPVADEKLQEELRLRVREFMLRYPFSPDEPADINPELLANLEALGYLH